MITKIKKINRLNWLTKKTDKELLEGVIP